MIHRHAQYGRDLSVPNYSPRFAAAFRQLHERGWYLHASLPLQKEWSRPNAMATLRNALDVLRDSTREQHPRIGPFQWAAGLCGSQSHAVRAELLLAAPEDFELHGRYVKAAWERIGQRHATLQPVRHERTAIRAFLTAVLENEGGIVLNGKRLELKD